MAEAPHPVNWRVLTAEDAHASAPIGWLADFHATQARLREWVALSGTRLDRDRPTRQTVWPGEVPEPTRPETPIIDPAAYAGSINTREPISFVAG